ncbi:MAG: hypothetical protein AB1593_07955 [Pseudomonadota bacterium]
MLRTLILAAGLLAASGTALAYDDYGHRHGRVISVEPHFTISFGSRHHDGFRILYESGGYRYWTHSHYRPGPVIVLPPRHVRHIHHHRHGGWHDRHDWRDDRHDWRHDWRHDRRDDRREHRRHGRDD